MSRSNCPASGRFVKIVHLTELHKNSQKLYGASRISPAHPTH
jgi:hypothetical protein